MALLNDEQPVHQSALGSRIANSHADIVLIVGRQQAG